jgi:RimJ/RimL family protein N-acetyltransferase
LAWRLHPRAQGQGLATEGAIACRDYIFDVLHEPLVTAMTAVGNVKSRRVMERCGLTYQSGMDFDHPRLPPGHPLSRHVFYALRR